MPERRRFSKSGSNIQENIAVNFMVQWSVGSDSTCFCIDRKVTVGISRIYRIPYIIVLKKAKNITLSRYDKYSCYYYNQQFISTTMHTPSMMAIGGEGNFESMLTYPRDISFFLFFQFNFSVFYIFLTLTASPAYTSALQ